MKKFTKVIAITAGVILALSLVTGIVTVGLYGWNFKNYGSYYLNGGELSDFSDVYDDISYIDADIALGDVVVVQGDTYSIDAKNVPSGTLECKVVDGNRLVIKQKNRSKSKFFGFSISDYGWNFGLMSNPHQNITITVKSDFLERFNLETGFGDVYVDGVKCNESKVTVGMGNFELKNTEVSGTLKIGVGTGDAKIDNINLGNGNFNIGMGKLDFINSSNSGKLDIDVGTGDARLENINANNFKFDGGLGSAKILKTFITGGSNIHSGTGDLNFTGGLKCDSYFDVGLGSCSITLSGNSEDYNLDLDVSLGESRVNGNKSLGKFNSKNAKYDLKADIGTGDLNLDFEEE